MTTDTHAQDAAAAPTVIALPDGEVRETVRLDTTHHIIVDANPGSGKTYLLTEKLLTELGPDRSLVPNQLVAVTFTRAAAAELRGRLTEGCLRRLRDEPSHRHHWSQQLQRLDQAMIGTIDHFISSFLHRYGAMGALPEAPALLEPAAARELAMSVALQILQQGTADAGTRLLLQQYDLLPAQKIIADAIMSVETIAVLQRQAGGEMIGGDDPASAIASHHEQEVARTLLLAHEAFDAAMSRQGTADYGRLLRHALSLARVPAVLEAFRRDIALLCVDEHQDTSELQVRFFQRLLGLPAPREEGATRGFFLGDCQQSIYRFRGADIRMWKLTERLVLKAGGLQRTLTATFRTRPALVQALNDTVGTVLRTPDAEVEGRYDAISEPMVPVRPDLEAAPAPLTFLRAEDKGHDASAAALAAFLAEALRHPERHPVSDPDGTIRPLAARDVAILSPVLRGVAPAYVQALSAAGIPVRVQGGSGLFARPEIEEMIQALRAVVSEDMQEMVSWLQGPFGGVPFDTLMQATHGVPLRTTIAEALDGRGDPALLRAMERRHAWRTLVDQLPHAVLAERMLEESGARGVYAGRPDGLIATRNLARMVDLLASPPFVHQPLWTVALRLKAVVDQRDYEEEAACFAEGDDVVTIATIHQSKGLEWPLVFLVGQEGSVAFRANEDVPAVHPEWGVLLPLSVEVDGEADATPRTQRWMRYVMDQEAGEVAESKRKLFVAGTRARDYLVVVGPFTIARWPRDLSPTTLVGPQGKRIYDPVLRWWRFLGRPALGTNPAAAAVAIGQTLCPILTAPPLEALPTRRDVDHGEAVHPHQIGPVAPDMPLRAEISASELVVYDRCVHQHAHMFRDGINLPELDVAGGDAAINRLLPADRGTILHRYLRLTTAREAEDVRRARMATAIRTTVSMPESALEESVEIMMGHANTVEQSAWWARVLAAATVHRELNLTVRVTDDTLVRVTLDVVWQDPDGTWNIMDFKSLILRGVEGEALQEAITARIEGYRLQVAAYTTALRRVLGSDIALGHFVFLLSGLGQSREVPMHDERLDAAEALVQATIAGVQGPRPRTLPVWRQAVCTACPVRAVCSVRDPAARQAA